MVRKMEFHSFPSIEQYRNAIRNVKQHVSYDGVDENGDAKFKHAVAPTLNYVGTVKLHGTNSAVVQNAAGEVWCQSRNNIISVEKDNAGFARFIIEAVTFEDFNKLFSVIRQLPYVREGATIAIFGEWCGQGIQKKVAIAELPKMFVIFAVRVIYSEEDSFWVDREVVATLGITDKQVYNVFMFKTYELQIDFENPHVAQEKLIAITEEVEKECPVGAHFGVKGTGEGVVWTCVDEAFKSSKFTFKVKGEEHSASKVKTLAAVDVERINSIKALVDTLVAERRLQQGIEFLKEQHLDIDPKNIGPFLKWVANDVFKEERDTIVENGFTDKDVGKEISNKARTWFLQNLDNV